MDGEERVVASTFVSISHYFSRISPKPTNEPKQMPFGQWRINERNSKPCGPRTMEREAADASDKWAASTPGVYSCPDSGERHPRSVVWTSLPIITWFLPPIGHTGISFLSGVITDFSGPYRVTIGSFMGGPARRVWVLDSGRIEGDMKIYDEAVRDGAQVYGKHVHNLVVNNCHSHVACVLNRMQYDGRSDWSTFL